MLCSPYTDAEILAVAVSTGSGAMRVYKLSAFPLLLDFGCDLLNATAIQLHPHLLLLAFTSPLNFFWVSTAFVLIKST